MSERIISVSCALKRLRSGVLGNIADALAAHLHERGHCTAISREYICVAGHLAHWLDREGISPAELNEDVVAGFVQRHLPRCRCSVPRGPRRLTRAALAQLLILLRKLGQIPAPTVVEPSPVDALIARFDNHLVATCGATAATRLNYTKLIRRFLAPRHGNGPVTLEDLRPGEIVRFVSRMAEDSKPETVHAVRTALRSFLRFAELHGLCGSGLAEAVPKVAQWRRASLPVSLTEKQLNMFLKCFDRSNPTGRRDYAMALCLAMLGMRAGDVTHLTLDDFDWRAGTVQLGIDKERRATVFPMPPAVGRAIVSYLRHGRPETTDRHVFVRHALPRGQMISAQTVAAAIRRGLARANIRVSPCGSHLLRHTAATRMVRAGASLKQVADILRHRSLNTVMIYTKVDLPRLAEVAMPWPEVRP